MSIVQDIIAEERDNLNKARQAGPEETTDFAMQLPERLARHAKRMAEKCDLEIPDEETSVRLIKAILTHKKLKSGGVQWRALSRYRKNATDDEYCAFKWYEFHSGRNVNITGIMMAHWGLGDRELEDRIDNLMRMLSILLTGRHSVGGGAWNRALNGR